jgi:hypothetical protein
MGGRERMNVLQPNKKAAIITLLTNGPGRGQSGTGKRGKKFWTRFVKSYPKRRSRQKSLSPIRHINGMLQV